jgi:hypothetical protein
MASFISSLLFVILILANGCFTLPVGDEQSSSSTFSSLNDDLTTEKVFNLSLVSDVEQTTVPNIEPTTLSDVEQTTVPNIEQTTVSDVEQTTVPYIEPKQPVDQHAQFEISTSTDNLLAEKAFQASSTYDQFSTSEPFTSTIQDSLTDKSVQNELLLTTVESITETVEHALRSLNSDSENEVEPQAGQGQYDNSLSNKYEPNAQGGEFESQNRENNSEERHNKRAKQVELTTSFMPSFTSTSSAIAPELYTSESSTSTSTSTSSSTSTSTSSSTSSSTPSSTSTKKYIGLLTDEEQHGGEEEQQQQPKKPIRTQIRRKSQKKLTTTIKPKLESEDQPEEDSKEPFIPIAVYQQDTLKTVVNVPNDFLILEENDGIIVTDFPSKLSQVTTENPSQPKPLNQGKKSTQPEEKKSDN